MFNLKHEKLNIILFFAVLTIILTWPVFGNFFSSVASSGPDTMQVIGVAGSQANLLAEKGVVGGTLEIAKRSELGILTIYAYFQLIFGRVAGYNLLFFLSFILSGFGAYLLAFYFTKDKPASLLAGIIFAFSPFHIHNSISTNVGTMHQEWLPLFALYLFKFFDNLKLKNFMLSGLFLFLIGFSEHQLLAFTAIFILFFLVYKIISQPKVFVRGKLWIYFIVSASVFAVVFFFMFRSLFEIVNSENNYLNAGFKSAVKYSNDVLSIFVPPAFHSFWPESFSHLRNQFERSQGSTFSVYAGFAVLILSLFAIIGAFLRRKKDAASKIIRKICRKKIPTKGLFFWMVVAVGFYILSVGPQLHYKGLVSPPVRMPYVLIYDNIPFFDNIRTVGRMFIYSMLAFSVLGAWGMTYLEAVLKREKDQEEKVETGEEKIIEEPKESPVRELIPRSVYALIAIVVIIEFLAVPLKTNTLLHSSFYERLGQDKEKYNVLEVPGSTDYDFASRDLVWKSIHQKDTVNGYDFARVIKDNYTFQRGTPIIRTLLYDLPGGDNGNDRDIMKSSYYNISSEILNYYNIRYVILDKEGLRGNPEKGDLNMLYPIKAYIKDVIECKDEFEDDFLYACQINRDDVPEHIFLAMDYSNNHWVGKSDSKNGLQRWAENGAGLKLINMSGGARKSRLSFNLKIDKPLRIKVFLNGEEIFNKYITQIGAKHEISADFTVTKPGENDIIFGVYAADNSEIHSEKKSDTARIYQVEVDQ